MNKNPHNLPTEKVDLPSKGLPYPIDHVLSQGYFEVIYPGARQEDILTNASYLDKGVAIDKFLDSILITDASLDDFLPGDRDALMLAGRILGLGKDYTTLSTVGRKQEQVSFDLTTLVTREVNWGLFQPGINEFSYTLKRGISVKYKLFNGHDINKMNEEETGMRKAQPEYSADTTLYLKHALVEVDGKRDTKSIRDFVDRQLLMADSRELKAYITANTPGYIWKADGIRANKEVVEGLSVPITVDFFWPAY